MKKLALSCLAILVSANAFVLAGAWYNRAATPLQSIELSERELHLPSWRSFREDSSVILQLNWQAHAVKANSYYGSRTVLVGAEQLKGLDIEPADYNAGYKERKYFTRQGFVVLELNGPSYQAYLANLQRLEQEQTQQPQVGIESRIDKARSEESRLFAIDAGADFEQLQQKYPQNNRLILPAQMRIDYYHCSNLRHNSKAKPEQQCQPNQYPLTVTQLEVPQIMLTSTQANKLKGLKSRNYKEPYSSRFAAKVSWGGLYRPWVADIWLTPNQAAPTLESD